jgi:segregation and condensation protein B
MTNEERKAALEAIIYAADEPATVEQLAVALNEERLVVQAALDELVASYATEERGIEMRAVAGGYKLYTKPQHHEMVRRFIKSLRPPLRLTMPALETLAVISYKQPVTGPEIAEIRGVNTSGVLKTLLDKRLITTAGRKEVMGRPILYRTSKEFLVRFGLSDLGELPSLKEFEALAREALGSDEGTAQEETYSSSLAESASPELALDAVAAAELQAELRAGDTAGATHAHATSRGEDAESVAAYESEASEAEQAATPPSETAMEDVANDALDRGPSTVGKDLLEEERAATSEGMPAGEVDEAPKAEAASAGE